MGNPDSEERSNLCKQDLASKPQNTRDSHPDLSEATICSPEHYMPPDPTTSSFSLNIDLNVNCGQIGPTFHGYPD